MTKRSTQKKREARGSPFSRGNDLWKGKYKPQNPQCPVPSSQLTPLPSPYIHEQPHFRYNLRRRDLEMKENDFKGNRVISLVKMLEAINEIVHEHSKMRCTNSNIEYENEFKRGLGSRLQFRCNTCGYKSTSMKMYDEIQNTKRASINTNLASALMDTPMGPYRAEEFFTQLDIPFLCTSHLQKLTRDVNTKIVDVNNRDMAEKRNIIAQCNSAQTSSDPMQIDISMDARYNRQRMTCSYKPGQSSSQAYAIATENHTDDNYIIGLATENKLCWTGAALRNKGSNITCPGHVDCTANLSYFTPHSERRMAFDIAKDLHEDGFYVRTLTTDGDTKAYLGMKDFYSTSDDTWEVTRQSDPNHLAARQQRKARNAAFSARMFKFSTKQERQAAQAVLARDIRTRCNAVIEQMARRGKGDITKMIKDLPNIRAATVKCYDGNCSNCERDSLVCSGEGIGCWWNKSDILGPSNIHDLNMTDDDKTLIEGILCMRLSETAIYSVCSRTSTQKCEAFNRATSATMSKSISYSRTFIGRLSAQILRSNNPRDRAVNRKLKAVSGTALCRWARKRLRQITRRSLFHKRYNKTDKVKQKRRARRARFEYEHRLMMNSRKNTEPEYVKGLLDDSIGLEDDIHTYSYRPKPL